MMDRRLTTFAVLALMWLGMATVALRVVEPVVNPSPRTGLEKLIAQRQDKTTSIPTQAVSDER